MLEDETQFRRIVGHGAKLALAVEHEVAAKRAVDTPTTAAHTLRRHGAGGRRFTRLR